jgi:hypothetical protein
VPQQIEGTDHKRCAQQHQSRIGRGEAGPAQNVRVRTGNVERKYTRDGRKKQRKMVFQKSR